MMTTGLGHKETSPCMNLGTRDFTRIAILAQSSAGLNIPESKKTMVQSRVSRRLRATGFPDFQTYLDHVESDAGSREREQLISALTTNVSHFFREEHHFSTLRQAALPSLLERARNGGKVRIWSAGCSTGQEPYTLAMTMLELDSEATKFDIRVLATDIDSRVLSTAKTAQYDGRQMASVPISMREKYFQELTHQGAQNYVPCERVKQLVSFRQLNLMDAWPMRSTFDIIFCRNVVIYFSEETQATLWPRFCKTLGTGGWLFLGHSERIPDPVKCGFEVVGITTYRRI